MQIKSNELKFDQIQGLKLARAVIRPLSWRSKPPPGFFDDNEDGESPIRKMYALSVGGHFMIEVYRNSSILLWDAVDPFIWSQHATVQKAQQVAFEKHVEQLSLFCDFNAHIDDHVK